MWTIRIRKLFRTLLMLAVLADAHWITAAQISHADGVADAEHGTNSCSCPAATCELGSIDGCSVTCVAPQQARCQCDAWCSSHTGEAGGTNQCRCE
jgi:hypothetical protein